MIVTMNVHSISFCPKAVICSEVLYLAKRTQQYSSVKLKEALPLCSVSVDV